MHRVCLPDFARCVPLLPAILASMLACSLVPASAEPNHEATPTTPARLDATVANPSFVFAVFPAAAAASVPRTIFLSFTDLACADFVFTLDTSLLDSRNQVQLRTQAAAVACPTSPPAPAPIIRNFQFTPTKPGTITVRWDRGGGALAVETLAAKVASRYDVSGMWSDPATNGSGIALHHRRATDNAFGTWFLFDSNGDTRWYTLQFGHWLQDGSVLTGLLFEVIGSCTTPNLVACPATGGVPRSASGDHFTLQPAVVRITFQSATRARAEVSNLSGKPLFSSDLTRLAL